jgi:hypothetical protein
MDADQLRVWLTKTVKRPLPDALWEDLVGEHYVDEALNGGSEERADLLRVAKRRLRYASHGASHRSPPGHRRRGEVNAELNRYERDREEALAMYLSAEAAATPRVRRFREEVLGQRLLTPQEARSLVTSKAAAGLSRATFRRRRVPIIGHRTSAFPQLLEHKGRRRVSHVWIPLDPPDRVFRRFLFGEIPRIERGTFAPAKDYLTFCDRERDKEVWTRVAPDSVLDELRQLAEWLARRYGWDEGEATSFVLRGTVPAIRAVEPEITIQLRDDDRDLVQPNPHPAVGATVTLRIAPWVSFETVRRTYRQAQIELGGKDNRPLGARNLAVFRFVVSRRTGQHSVPSWNKLMAEWNRVHREQQYADRRVFARDYHRVERTLTARRSS